MDEQQQQAHLAQFFRWAIPIIIFFNLAFVGVYLFTPETQFIFNALICFVTACAFVAARVLMQRGRFFAAVTLACGTLLALAASATIVSPHLSVINSLLPLIAAILAVQYIGDRALLYFLIVCWVTIIVVTVLGALLPTTVALTPQLVFGVNLSSFGAIGAVILLLLWQFSNRFGAVLVKLRSTNRELQANQSDLEQQIAARTSALEQALADVRTRADAQTHLLEEVAQQRAVIRELSVPVIPVNQRTLVMPLVGAFDAARLHDVQEQALRAIERVGAKLLVLDITGVPLVDSHVAQGILTVVQATQLLGAETVLVGIRPEVAQTMVGLGLAMPGLRTASSLQDVLTE